MSQQERKVFEDGVTETKATSNVIRGIRRRRRRQQHRQRRRRRRHWLLQHQASGRAFRLDRKLMQDVPQVIFKF